MGQLTLPAGGLVELRQAIEQTATSDSVAALREAGRRLAAGTEGAIRDAAGRPLSGLTVGEFWQAIGRYFNQLGWGDVEHQTLVDGVGALVARDWAEADPDEGRAVPGCHISTGLLAELLSRVVGRPVAVLEAECRSRGDPACRFLFGAQETLLTIHGKLASGAELEEALAAVS